MPFVLVLRYSQFCVGPFCTASSKQCRSGLRRQMLQCLRLRLSAGQTIRHERRFSNAAPRNDARDEHAITPTRIESRQFRLAPEQLGTRQRQVLDGPLNHQQCAFLQQRDVPNTSAQYFRRRRAVNNYAETS